MDYPLQPDAPDGRYVDSGANGEEGTVVRAQQMNALHDEIIHVIRASGQEPDANNVEQLLAAMSVLGGSSGRNNWVVNGGFQVWQRGDTHDTWDEPIYTADRWEVQADGNGGNGRGVVSHQQDASAPASLKGRWDFLRYEGQIEPTVGGAAIRTKLEVLQQLSGHRLTLSFLVRGSSPMNATVEISRSIEQSQSVIATDTVEISQGWEERQITFDLPNMTPVPPSDFPSYLQIDLRLPSIGTSTVELGGVQLGIGAAPVDFVQRPFALEYFLCRRYFQTSGDYGATEQSSFQGGPLRVSGRIASIYASSQSFQQFAAERFVPEMRAIPSVSLFAGAPGGPAGRVDWLGSSGTVSQIFNLQRGSMGAPVIVGGGPSIRSDCKFRWAADAEI